MFTRPVESKNQLVEEQASLKGGYKNTTVVGLISRMLKREYHGTNTARFQKLKCNFIIKLVFIIKLDIVDFEFIIAGEKLFQQQNGGKVWLKLK